MLPAPAGGVPLRMSLLVSKESQEDRAAGIVVVIFGAGVPLAFTLKDSGEDPTVMVAKAALVNFGAWPTVKVKVCVADPAELLAVKVRV